MIFLEEFIELDVNIDMMIKNCETCGIKNKYCDCVFEYTNVKDDLKNTNVCVLTKLSKQV